MNLDHDQSTPKLMTKSGSDSCRDCTKLHCPQNVYILNHLGHCSQILRLHPWALNSGKYTGVPAFVSVPTLIQREGQPKLDVVTGCVFLISQPQTKHIGPRPCCRTICWRCTVPNHLNSSPRASGQKMIIYIYIYTCYIYIYMRYVCLYTCIYIYRYAMKYIYIIIHYIMTKQWFKPHTVIHTHYPALPVQNCRSGVLGSSWSDVPLFLEQAAQQQFLFNLWVKMFRLTDCSSAFSDFWLTGHTSLQKFHFASHLLACVRRKSLPGHRAHGA